MLPWLLGGLAAVAIVGLLGAELWARRLVRRLRAGFQWLITERDEAPPLSEHGLQKFIREGYDPELGWVRKPNTSGVEQGRQGAIVWRIDAFGARHDPYLEGTPARIVAVGDSFTFARQVPDAAAWPAVLSRRLGVRVANFGVGNYGVDQAILRYEREGRVPGARVALLGVVPETIVRIHSAWKHYSEYGNTFAFKPRFRLVEGQLELCPNVITQPEQFARYTEFLPELQARDLFYRSKFCRDMIRPPYLWRWLASARNRRLVALLRARERRRAHGMCDASCEAAPFRSVLERNLRLAAAMYDRAECCALFAALVQRFARLVRAAGAEPVLIMFPQPLDWECFGAAQPYRPLLARLQVTLRVLDAAALFLEQEPRRLGVDDQHGGHYSVEGNEAVARFIAHHVAPLFHEEAAPLGTR